ncbi:MAG: hypothetical protein KGK34_11115, partial [Chloroflexota bacterium]|nr:hypothetical protein [Chloroflexota bacterium]
QEGAALRPLGVGDIVDRVFALYRARPLMYLAIAAIPYLVLMLVLVALTAVFGGSLFAVLLAGDVTTLLDRLAASLGILVLYGSLAVVASLIMSLVQSAALVAATAARYMRQETSVGSALRIGLRASPRLLGMGVVAVVAIGALWTVLIVVMAVSHQWWSVLIAFLVGIVATLYLAASWMVSPAVAVLESSGPLASLGRAWRLADGGRWRILGLILLLLILQLVVSSLLSFLVVASLVADRTVQVIVQQAVNLLATIAWAPVYWGTFAILYYDLRVRKEALDLQLAAEALPRDA